MESNHLLPAYKVGTLTNELSFQKTTFYRRWNTEHTLILECQKIPCTRGLLHRYIGLVQGLYEHPDKRQIKGAKCKFTPNFTYDYLSAVLKLKIVPFLIYNATSAPLYLNLLCYFSIFRRQEAISGL